MSKTDNDRDRPRTRQAVKEGRKKAATRHQGARRSEGQHSSPHSDHLKKCFICYTEAERQASARRRQHRHILGDRLPPSLSSNRRTPSRKQQRQKATTTSSQDTQHCGQDTQHCGQDTQHCGQDTQHSGQDTQHCGQDTQQSYQDIQDSFQDKSVSYKRTDYPSGEGTTPKSEFLVENKTKDRKPDSEWRGLTRPSQRKRAKRQELKSFCCERLRGLYGLRHCEYRAAAPEGESDPVAGSSNHPGRSEGSSSVSRTLQPVRDIESVTSFSVRLNSALASTTKQQQQQQQQQQPPQPRPPAPAPPSGVSTPPKPANNIPLPPGQPATSKCQVMATVTGPLTRLQAHSIGALEGQHHQVSASGIDESTLDQCFQVSPKWHYIKSSHEETAQWLDTAGFEAILFELLYFVHDQSAHGHHQHKEAEAQFEKELERAMAGIEKLDCLDAFCKTFIRDNQFRPAGRLTLSGTGKDDKYGRLFRIINADLQSLQRQHRILAMVCSGTADHEVHTQAQRENLRKLVEDLISIVHPSERATYHEVYKVIAENAAYDKRNIKPQLSSLKLVSLPDIVVPFGGPVTAGGSPIKCDTLEQKIRAKLPSLLVKMHFSEKVEDQKWSDLGHIDDSGIADDTGTGSPRSRSRDRTEERPAGKTPSASGGGGSGKTSGKRKHEDTTPTRSKRHREDLRTRDTQPPDAHVINEIYGEHVAQLICSLTSTPIGYVKHCRYPVVPGDERDGTASVTVLGMIVSGDDIYLTKMDASHDYLDSLVETFRMDQVSFSCLANPLSLYKGSHLKALLLFLRHVCLNFPRTTYFLSD